MLPVAHAGPPRLLAAHPVFATHDVDQARERVANVFCAHQLHQAHAAQRLDCHMHGVALGALSLNYLCYGADVDITPGCLNDFYLVQIPLSGRADVRYGRQQVGSDAATAVVLSPHRPVAMRWQGECAQVMLRLPRALVEQRVAELPQSRAGATEFDLALAQRGGPAAGWCQLVLELARNIDAHGATWLRHEAAAASLQDVLLRGLLALQPHACSAALQAPVSPAPPRHVRRAREFIEANAEQAITMADIARAACVSERALQEGFRRHLGTTPNTLLREVRLQRVREQLQAVAAGADGAPASLHEIAHRYGFFHLGRFAAYYKARFGESPSTTRRGD